MRKVVTIDPEYAAAYKDLGIIYMSRKQFDYAEIEFKNALKCKPDDFSIVFEYANYLHATTHFEEADEMYEKALSLNPEDHQALAFSALNKILLKDFDTAAQRITKAIEKQPNSAFYLYIAAKIKYNAKDYEEAKRYLVSAYEKNPTLEIENLLALTYFELGNWEIAANLFNKIINENGDNLNLLLYLARCYEKLGETDKALEKLYVITDLFPDCESAQEMIRRIS